MLLIPEALFIVEISEKLNLTASQNLPKSTLYSLVSFGKFM